MAEKNQAKPTLGATLFGAFLFTLIRMICFLPYNQRIGFAGWFFGRIVGPFAGMNRRARRHLKLIYPDIDAKEARRISRAVSDNAGRLIIENFSTSEFVARAAKAQPQGPGFEAMKQATLAGRPVILVSGHYGNYQAVRIALAKLGREIAGIYRPLNNAFLNERYVETMQEVAGPNFPRGIKGTKSLLRHLRKGGSVAMLIDQHAQEGHALDFLGKPAKTILSAAEFALKYDALLIPSYGIRKENGLDFDVFMEAPIEPSDPVTMTQALNDSLGGQITRKPEQWLWIHRRWK